MAEKLAQNENKLRIIVESEPELVVLQAADGTVLEMNPAGLALIGADAPEDIMGRPLYQIVAPEYRPSYEALTRGVFRGEPKVLEFRIVGMRGDARWLEMHAFPLRDASGRIIALTGIARDITERKQAEEQTGRHQAELARVSRLSTMGEMASGIAHELNQPLSAIANYAQGSIRRIRSGAISQEELLEALEQVLDQAERAGHIIRHVRNFVRKREPNWSIVDLNAAVREICVFTEPEARQNCITIDTELAPQLPLVRADNIEIQQVILNLVRNAIEAMTDPAIKNRKLMLRTCVVNEGTVEVGVSDTGPGISSKIVEQVFDPFFTTKIGGMGMGLSISRSIVEAHGGRLWVTENPERGVTFKFTLPIANVG